MDPCSKPIWFNWTTNLRRQSNQIWSKKKNAARGANQPDRTSRINPDAMSSPPLAGGTGTSITKRTSAASLKPTRREEIRRWSNYSEPINKANFSHGKISNQGRGNWTPRNGFNTHWQVSRSGGRLPYHRKPIGTDKKGTRRASSRSTRKSRELPRSEKPDSDLWKC